NYGENWEIYQQGTYAPDDGENRWMASIDMNDNGDIALGYSVSSSSTYPSIRIAGQTNGAPMGLGVLDIDEISILDGNASQTGVNRWGDYSHMAVDGQDGETFWFTTEYSSGGWNWKTQIASFGFSQEPIANFAADETIIPVGETVNFTDEYDVQLIATNDLGTDTIVKEGYIVASSTVLPEVDFSADKSFVCTGETVDFTDHTTISPIQWLWEFSPATVTFVNGTDETSQNPEVIFDEAGTYSVSLTSWNLNGSTSMTIDDMVTAGGFTPYFKETFEDNGFASQYWTVENPDDDVTWGIYEIGGTAPGNLAAGLNFSVYYTIGERDRLIARFGMGGGDAAAGRGEGEDQQAADASDALVNENGHDEGFGCGDRDWVDDYLEGVHGEWLAEGRNCNPGAANQFQDCLEERVLEGLCKDEALDACQPLLDSIPSNLPGDGATLTSMLNDSSAVRDEVSITLPAGGGAVSGEMYYEKYDAVFICTFKVTTVIQGTFDPVGCSLNGTAQIDLSYEGLACPGVCGSGPNAPAPCPVTRSGSTVWKAELVDGELVGDVGDDSCDPYCFMFSASQ
ncbi:MAG: PKD domain-containing protein, partial [Desulfuromonadales bacterium]